MIQCTGSCQVRLQFCTLPPPDFDLCCNRMHPPREKLTSWLRVWTGGIDDRSGSTTFFDEDSRYNMKRSISDASQLPSFLFSDVVGPQVRTVQRRIASFSLDQSFLLPAFDRFSRKIGKLVTATTTEENDAIIYSPAILDEVAALDGFRIAGRANAGDCRNHQS